MSSGCTASRRQTQPPLAIWAALILTAVPLIYLSIPGGDAHQFPLAWLGLALYGYFLIVRRSRVAWWILMVTTVVGLLRDATSGVFDAYIVLSVACFIGTAVTLLLAQSRDWVPLWR